MNNTKIEICIPGLFNPQECLWFLNRGYDDCIYKVFPDKIRRAFRSGEEIMLVDIYLLPGKLILEWLNGHPSNPGKELVLAFVNNWFDLSSDLNTFYQMLGRNEKLAYMSKEFTGLKFIGMPDFFEAITWCIIGQQINLTFAYKIKRRLVEYYGTSILFDGHNYYLFPAVSTIATALKEELRAMQFSEKKAEYLISVAVAITTGSLSKETLKSLPDLSSKIRHLTNQRGIGLWTANYVLMKSLKEPSCIPYGDAGLLNALINHRIIEEKNDTRSIEKLFDNFKGWESYLVFYLWRSLARR